MVKKKKNIIDKLNEKEAWAVIIFIFSIIIFISIIGYDFQFPLHPDSIGPNDSSSHLMGKFGVFISYILITKTIGVFSIVFPVILLLIA